MHALSLAYQKERHDLEGTDLTPLVIEALCDFGINPTPTNPANPTNPINIGSLDDAEIQFSTADITALVKTLAQNKEAGAEADKITTHRVGRVFRGIRLEEVQRPSGKQQPGTPKPSRARQWKTTKGNLRACLVSYHMDIPEEYEASASTPQQTQNTTPLSPPLNGVNGVDGVNGGVRASPQGPSQSGEPCPHCGQALRLVVGGRGVYCTSCRYTAVVT
jgi:hypothetical protein